MSNPQDIFYTIGEFSRMTGLSVKALRLYHEKLILIPFNIDKYTKYRLYNKTNIDQARVIIALRQMDFQLKEIREILENFQNDEGIIQALESQKLKIKNKILNYHKAINTIDSIILREQHAREATYPGPFEIEEKDATTLLFAGLKFNGAYPEAGKYFHKLARLLKSNICGTPFCLYHDEEYKEDNAQIEVCFPIQKGKTYKGVHVGELAAVRVISLIHKGPYENLCRSYTRLISFLKSRNQAIALPIREIYHKGPGMVFKGNPGNYLTEIQIQVKEAV